MNNKRLEVSIFPDVANSLINSAIHFFDSNVNIYNDQIKYNNNQVNNIDELLQLILQSREEDNNKCI